MMTFILRLYLHSFVAQSIGSSSQYLLFLPVLSSQGTLTAFSLEHQDSLMHCCSLPDLHDYEFSFKNVGVP